MGKLPERSGVRRRSRSLPFGPHRTTCGETILPKRSVPDQSPCPGRVSVRRWSGAELRGGLPQGTNGRGPSISGAPNVVHSAFRVTVPFPFRAGMPLSVSSSVDHLPVGYPAIETGPRPPSAARVGSDRAPRAVCHMRIASLRMRATVAIFQARQSRPAIRRALTSGLWSGFFAQIRSCTARSVSSVRARLSAVPGTAQARDQAA